MSQTKDRPNELPKKAPKPKLKEAPKGLPYQMEIEDFRASFPTIVLGHNNERAYQNVVHEKFGKTDSYQAFIDGLVPKLNGESQSAWRQRVRYLLNEIEPTVRALAKFYRVPNFKRLGKSFSNINAIKKRADHRFYNYLLDYIVGDQYYYSGRKVTVWQEDAYWGEVDRMLSAYKFEFDLIRERSPDPARSLRNEIKKINWLLYPNDNPETPEELDLDRASHLGPSVATLLNGKREFAYNSKTSHYHQTQADTFFKYLDWLRELQAKDEEVQVMDQTDTQSLASMPHGAREGGQTENEPHPRGIHFTDPDIIIPIHGALKGFFLNKDSELLALLEGGTVDEPLHFNSQQNILAEVFSRAHYNQKIIGTKTDLQNWIARNFTYLNHRTRKPTRCNLETLRGVFSPKEGCSEIPKSKRIMITGLPYVLLSERVDRG